LLNGQFVDAWAKPDKYALTSKNDPSHTYMLRRLQMLSTNSMNLSVASIADEFPDERASQR
jgi:hypothetical protein